MYTQIMNVSGKTLSQTDLPPLQNGQKFIIGGSAKVVSDSHIDLDGSLPRQFVTVTNLQHSIVADHG